MLTPSPQYFIEQGWIPLCGSSPNIIVRFIHSHQLNLLVHFKRNEPVACISLVPIRNAYSQQSWQYTTARCKIEGQERPVLRSLHADNVDTVRELCHNFFTDPSQSSDNRLKKTSSKCPDFGHVNTKELLRIDDWWKPPWLAAEVVSWKFDGCGAAHVEDNEEGCVGWIENNLRASEVDDARVAFGVFGKLCYEGELCEALQSAQCVYQEGAYISTKVFVHLLQRCGKDYDLAAGREVYSLIVRSGYVSDAFLGGYLIRMFALCGSLVEASCIFCKLSEPNIYAWSAIILAHVAFGQNEEAIQLYHLLLMSNVEPNGHIFVAALKACAAATALSEGRLIHSHIIGFGFETDLYVGNTLVDIYTKCGSLDDACRVFDRLPRRNVVTWSAMIAGHTQSGHGQEALHLFQQMQEQGIQANEVTFMCILKACILTSSLDQGKLIHTEIVESGLDSDAFVGSTLIDMYAKCGSLENACIVFDRLPKLHVVTWNAIITGYVHHGHGNEALKLFEHMDVYGLQPNNVTLICILKACSSVAALDKGKLMHALSIESGFESDLFIGNTLIDMYFKCGRLEDAHTLFDRLPKRNAVSWNEMIAGYTQLGHALEAFELFYLMKEDGIKPNKVTFLSILKACVSTTLLDDGKHIHGHIIECGFESEEYIGSTLIYMYTRCGSIYDATLVFDRVPIKDVVAWSALVAGYAGAGHGEEALILFERMQREGIEPDEVTFVCILKACSSIMAVNQIHGHLIKNGFEFDVPFSNTLIDMYANCGSLSGAARMFSRLPKQETMTWSAVIAGYALHGEGQVALQLFQHMQGKGMEPDKVTLVWVLKACTAISGIEQGKLIHAHIIEIGFELDVVVSNALVDMYAKGGGLDDACILFSRLSNRNTVTWNTMFAGYSEHGRSLEALQLFQQMQHQGVKPDVVTFICTLKACSNTAALTQGTLIHANIIESGYESDSFVGNTLVDMYNKCGSLDNARRLLGRLPKRDVVTWSVMIAGFAQHSDYMLSVKCFEDMQLEGVKPNDVTFLCLLSACSHVGLVDRGCYHFKIMREQFGIPPSVEHYNSLVELFGQAGHLNDAKDVLETIPFRSNVVGWKSLLSSCRTYDNVEIGKQAFDNLIIMDSRDAAGYVLMSDIYVHAGMQDLAQEIEELRRLAGVWKKPAKAVIEVGNKVHNFIVGDQSHPQSDHIYAELNSLKMQMKNKGYMSHAEDKEDALCGHCEKLALALGLICTPQGSTIRVVKNLRVCADCHDSMKIISKIKLREIIVIDTYCIHHFIAGECSCRDRYHQK